MDGLSGSHFSFSTTTKIKLAQDHMRYRNPMSGKALSALVICLYFVSTLIHCSNDNLRKPYIVYMGEKPSASTSALQLAGEHQNLLLHAIQDEKIALESRIHSFSRSFNAFAAKLLPHEAAMLSENGGVVSVFPSTQRKLHTTRSWDFVGLPLDVSHRNSKAESDIIVAVLDTGIDITAPSFNDAGFGPPPAKWKGQCAMGVNFTGCNKKVIGARYYNLVEKSVVDEPSPADTEGHGTHTSSTAGGGYVLGASLYGLAEGTARGGVPSARIAMYKVCWPGGCSDVDLLAAFDDAIADGVDIINISIGGPSVDFFRDPIAIGAFHAMKKGILTACSAGNSGPYIGTVQNVAPWIMTVAATSSDRQFRTGVVLGNGVKTSGISVNTFSPRKKMYLLTSGTLASTSPYGNSSACDWGTLNSEKVKGKIVYCLGSSGQDYTIYGLGGAGTIMALDVVTDIALTHLIPATFVSGKDATDINQYINSTRNPQAVILKSRTVPIQAPFVASFSSRGPQGVTRNILKPDIAAPGLDILAGYSKLVSVTGQQADKRYSGFNIISGTSMASPHAAGAAAYVRTFHPEWSPAAIKSALMTTATPMTVLQPDAELGSGAGQINPTKAVHPGLIYDISTNAYIRFLCKEGYNTTTIALLTGGMQRYDCSSFKPALGTDGLNYPTIHTQLSSPNATITATFHRTVTNVGSDKSVYKANVVSPHEGLEIEVVPRMLSFNALNEKKPFKVVLKGGPMPAGVHIYSALLEWSDSKHSVKSPIVVFKPLAPF